MIHLQNVSRWYGQVIGLNDVTCDIGPGITALLGMNGAGKSTLLRLISGQIRPTTGELTVYGMEPFGNYGLYRRLGYCPEVDNFYEHYSGRRFVYYLARLTGMSPEEARKQSESAMERVGMVPYADRAIAGYSKGMRQRVKLAQAMLHNPDIILLDEPLTGLDPLGRHEYTTLLNDLAREGKIILVSSHILYEVEQMTQTILLLHRGRLLARGDLRTLRSLLDKHPHKVRIKTPEPRKLAERMAPLPNLVSMRYGLDSSLEMEVRDPNSFYDSIASLILDEDVPVTGMESPDNNLESLFNYLVEA